MRSDTAFILLTLDGSFPTILPLCVPALARENEFSAETRSVDIAEIRDD